MHAWTTRIASIIYSPLMAVLVGFGAHGSTVAQDSLGHFQQCAKEGERCAFVGTTEVAYGVGTKWAKRIVASSIQCGVAGFGIDPAPNEHKTCVLPVIKCAAERKRCEFSGVRTVRFGAHGVWITKTFKDGVVCGIGAFGYDPLPGSAKECFFSPVPYEKPINEITWLGTHNAIASSYYGISTQNSQRDGVTAQLERGARALEIDTVNDTPLGYPAGVYVCHCGKAPHSTSAVETQRLRSGKENQTSWPFELSGWTHPIPFTRFSTILQEIDKWMVANPAEIVIVLMENNSANSTQLDAEIEAAGLKTGIYRHADDKKWATRSELVRTNRRLILQVGDDADRQLGYRGEKSDSKYASPKYALVYDAKNKVNVETKLLQYGALTPAAYGNLNEYADPADAARAGNQLFVMGAFNSTLTDEITARAHNNYEFLNFAKANWKTARPNNPFYPSVIQVNQIHIGDALRFVNDINGTEYLISSKHDTIGDTSGNSWQLRFENNAVFNAGVVVTYWEDVTNGGVTVPVPKVINSGVLNAALGVARMINIPRNTSPGKPISVSVLMYSTGNYALYKEDISADFTGSPVPCFKATGILTSPKGGRCE